MDSSVRANSRSSGEIPCIFSLFTTHLHSKHSSCSLIAQPARDQHANRSFAFPEHTAGLGCIQPAKKGEHDRFRPVRSDLPQRMVNLFRLQSLRDCLIGRMGQAANFAFIFQPGFPVVAAEIPSPFVGSYSHDPGGKRTRTAKGAKALQRRIEGLRGQVFRVVRVPGVARK